MAAPLDAQDDKVTGNSAPARSDADVNLPSSQSPEGSGQKPTTVKPGANQWSTNYRQKNPLASFSSWTYGLTLYMLSPEAANYYAGSGKLPPDSKELPYAIVAQSGGINNSSEPRGLTFSGLPGPNEPGLDVFIDDLQFELVVGGADGSKTNTIATEFAFKIYEPTGFTFLTKLRKLSDYICGQSRLVKDSNLEVRPNLYQQHYMLGIKFYGYDVDGKILKASEVPRTENIMSDEYAIYQRLFPLIAREVTFTVSGRATVYQWNCVLQSLQIAYGVKYGEVKNPANLEGSTVGEILGSADVKNTKSLMGYMNAIQQDLKEQQNQEKTIKYDIKWIKNNVYDASVIKNSYMITDNEWARETAPMMKSVNAPQDSTVKVSVKAQTSNSRSKLINISGGQSLVSVIDQVIVKSSYITNTLLKEMNQRIQSITNNDNDDNKNLRWYTVKPVTTIEGRDQLRRDWVYNVTYEIIPYEIPYIKSTIVRGRSKYYGPVKLYEYTLTGGNTEVLNFEISYNNLFFVPQPASTSKDSSGKNKNPPATTPVVPVSSVASDATLGQINRGAEMAQSVRANLYSIGDQHSATIKIMGDPDFLMDSIGYSTQSKEFGKFYASNYSINPYGGQIFVEIVFKVAEDYKGDGLLDVTEDSIQFYPMQDQAILGNKGLIFYIRSVTSTFSKGKFEQTLDLYMVSPNQLIIADEKNKTANEQREQPAAGNEVRTSGASATIAAGNSDAGAGRGSSAFTATDPRRLDLPKTQNPNDDAGNKAAGKNTPPAQGRETDLSVNQRLKTAFSTGQDSAINKFRQSLGISVGGTRPGG